LAAAVRCIKASDPEEAAGEIKQKPGQKGWPMLLKLLPQAARANPMNQETGMPRCYRLDFRADNFGECGHSLLLVKVPPVKT
jgi:hypothetical protein